MAGRVAWWHLCSQIHTAWSPLFGLAGVTSWLTFDRFGRGHWSPWGAVEAVLLVGLLAVHLLGRRDGERWRRIAQDPGLVVPPVVVTR